MLKSITHDFRGPWYNHSSYFVRKSERWATFWWTEWCYARVDTEYDVRNQTKQTMAYDVHSERTRKFVQQANGIGLMWRAP